jgi:hypothetical protein
MQRRHFLAAAIATLAAPRALAQAEPPITQWKVQGSQGLDAIAFLGALSGGELYRRYYAADADGFAARLPEAVRADVPALVQDAQTGGFGLLWPSLANTLSGTDVATLDAVIAALADPEARVRPSFQASQYWDEKDWAWLTANAARLHRVFASLREAGFAAFLAERTAGLDQRIGELQRALVAYDVVRWQRKLTGRDFDPTIDVVLLYFSKPHGVKVQGQKFLQGAGNDIGTTVRVAAHEMLHPPFPMDGPAAKAALAVLEKDALITRIVRDHDPRWGYTTLEGYLNEDMCEALDQLISEALGVARNPADRWRKADDGMHVLAAGLYGLLRQNKWVDAGGDIAEWLARAVAAGRLAPKVLHPVAARVLERPADRLWPLA